MCTRASMKREKTSHIMALLCMIYFCIPLGLIALIIGLFLVPTIQLQIVYLIGLSLRGLAFGLRIPHMTFCFLLDFEGSHNIYHKNLHLPRPL